MLCLVVVFLFVIGFLFVLLWFSCVCLSGICLFTVISYLAYNVYVHDCVHSLCLTLCIFQIVLLCHLCTGSGRYVFIFGL